jgi:CheY-like chemotaxis protein
MARILVVDDERSVRETTLELLEQLGHEAREASGGSEALEAVQDWTPDVMVTDLYMPGMNGTELVRQARRQDEQLKCIVASGYATTATRQELAALGVGRVLDKTRLVGELPLRLNEMLGDAPPSVHEQPADYARERPQAASASIKVLVVDDHDGVRALVGDLCEELGYQVNEARNGKEAVERVERGTYDMIFMDIHMPQMNGIQAIQEIRTAQPQAFVVAMTGEANTNEIAKARRYGAYDCLSKPFEVAELRKVVEKFQKVANQRQKLHSREQARAEASARKHRSIWRRMGLHSKRGRRWFAAAVAAGVLVGFASVWLSGWLPGIQQTGETLSEVPSFMERVEGYLARDEQREVERQRR